MNTIHGNILDQTTIKEAILANIKKQINEVIHDEINNAISNIQTEIYKQADLLALNILRMYDIETCKDQIVITVRKDNRK